MISINGQALPPPTHLQVQWQDTLGQKSVNALGQVVRDVLGKKRRVTLRYARLSGEGARQVCDLVDPIENMTLTCPTLQGDVTFTCLCQSITCQMVHRENGADVWADVTVTLEEV